MEHNPTIGANKKKEEIRKGYSVFLHNFKDNTRVSIVKDSQPELLDSFTPQPLESLPNLIIKNSPKIINRDFTISMPKKYSEINLSSLTEKMTYKVAKNAGELNYIQPSIMKTIGESRRVNKLIELQNKIVEYSDIIYDDGPFIPIIPLIIYQTWYTKDLPPVMRSTVNRLISDNPQFQHVLYDDDECREFIQQNFDQVVVDAFDSLIPGAYKADLWRYCILYKNGGIYMDIKYQGVDKFSLYRLTNKEYFVRDMEWDKKRGIYNALMVCQPGNPKLWECIQKICENVKNRFYGDSPLEPTGPQLLAKYFSDNEYNSLILRHDAVKDINGNETYYIFKNSEKILVAAGGYRKEQKATQNIEHYTELWKNINIYK